MAQRTLSRRERLERTIHGQATDRVPVALWRHFPGDDQDPGSLAAVIAAFQREYDFDFVKVTPASSFCVKDWGVDDVWNGNGEGTRDYTRRAIAAPDEWTRLPRLDPTRGHLGAQLRCLELLRATFADETPFIQTIFSPLAQARNLAGGDAALVHLRRYPDALKAGLETITATTIDFIEAAKPCNIGGIFYAQNHATYRLLSEVEYLEFARPYDLRVLEAAKDLWLNVLHLHGNEIMFDLIADYPAAVVNWHDRETLPSLADGLKKVKGAACGGVRQWETLVRGTPGDVRRECADALRQTGGRRFILGTGCVTPIVAPTGNIRAVREAVEKELKVMGN
ncbi:MAG: uroporphyrinogen decarboxylase [Chloroflexi bacterium]|nr:uroporphyrinogen decarboxylase [Chloroflexota bacterium]